MPTPANHSKAEPREPAAELRSRRVTWTDPITTLQRAAALSREQMLHALKSGELARPPVAELIGFDLTDAGDGRAVMELDTGEHQCNPLGIVAGGVAATVLDAAMWFAVQTAVSETTIVTTTSLTVNFVRALPAAAGRVQAEAEAVRAGRRVATAQARLLDHDGHLFAHATATFSCANLATAN